MPQLPEWLNSSVRQIIAAVGVILAALDLIEPALWDQIAPAIIAIGFIAYDVFRTKDLEDENTALKSANVAFKALYDDATAVNTKLVAERAGAKSATV